jgi:arginase
MTDHTSRPSAQRGATGRVALLGLPYDASSSLLRGPAAAPPLIRAALDSESSNGWSESLVDLRAPGLLGDAGDVDVGGPEDVRARIESAVTAVLDTGARPLCLGGDHSVTYPVVRALRPRYPRLALLHLDAHPDLYDSLDGDRYSHACPFARIMEEGLVDRLVQVGIRTMNGHQRAQAERFGVEVIPMREWDNARVFTFDEPLYVSVDLDVLDPAFAPGVSHREPGGLSVRELVSIIQRTRAPSFVGGDVVEFNPTVDPVGLTAWVAAKVVRELAVRLLNGQST